MNAVSTLGRGFGGLLVLLLASASGGLLALSPDIALPVAILLLPGVIALTLDRSPGCGMARAVLLFQVAACIHPVSSAWYRCSGIEGCMNYLAEWPEILRVWLAGAVAWLLTQMLPLGLNFMDEYKLRSRRSMLAAQREALIEEWDLSA